MNLLNQSQSMTPTRRALSAAGIATVALSLILSIAPTLAANDGTVKLFDTTTNEELGNDPHVCSFYAVFYSNSPEAGSWWLIDWDGAKGVVDEGDYVIADGSARTKTMSPEAGHYRFEWLASGARNSKNKTFWVDSSCAASQPVEPSEEPSDDPTPTPTPSEVTTPSDDPTPTPTPSEVTTPSDDPTPTPREQAVGGSQSTPAPSQVEQDVQAGRGSGSTSLPDTAVPVGESGVLATIGVLLVIAAHAGTRRERTLPIA